MPGATRRTKPARTSSLWLGTSASAGSSRRVRRNSDDMREITAGLLGGGDGRTDTRGYPPERRASNALTDPARMEGGSEQNRGEFGDLAEAHPVVGRARRGVEIVDVQRHQRGEVAQRVLDHRRHPALGDALAAEARIDPDALDLAHLAGDGADLGLEDDLA